jgi:uncharacterized membrane protein YoaT (DUF817 family)
MSPPLPDRTLESAAAIWWPLGRMVALERRIGAAMSGTPGRRALYEFVRFGIKQAWACLFGAIMLAFILATHLWWPRDAILARYDFLFLAALAVQVGMLASGMETWEEAKVIFAYHLVGTLMELFKTGVGSWTYPEASFFRIAGVPLFSGFMYACVGSYIARAWRLFAFRFTHHPPLWALAVLSAAIYANFYAHHFVWDARPLLFAAAALLTWRTRIYFTVWRTPRWMPLLLGLLLVTLFLWFAENLGTWSRAWLYPNQAAGWRLVSLAKFGSWFLLMIISYTLVAVIARPREQRLPLTAVRTSLTIS